MNVEALAGLNGDPVDQRVKVLTGLMHSGNDSAVAYVLSRADNRQVHELCLRSLRLLTDSRLELALLNKPVSAS